MNDQSHDGIFHLLLVEDNSDLAVVLSDLLRLKGYVVRRAKDGAQALRIMGEHGPPDLVITDLIMPGGDGWALREKMLDDANLESVPVIVMSAITPGPLEAMTYLQKPVEFHLLLDTIEANLGPVQIPQTGNSYKKSPAEAGQAGDQN